MGSIKFGVKSIFIFLVLEKKYYKYIMILNLFAVIIALIIPFILFVMPFLAESIGYSYVIPFEFFTYLTVSLIVAILITIFHIKNTEEACKTKNVREAILEGIKILTISFIWLMILNFFESITAPFYNIIGFENEFIKIFVIWIMLYAVIFLYIYNLNFSSIKNTCKPSIEKITKVYNKLESELSQNK